MATIDDLVASIEVEKEAVQHRLNKTIQERKAILAIVQQEGREKLNQEEDARFEELTQLRAKLLGDLRGAESKLANALKIKEEERELAEQATQTVKTDAGSRPNTTREQPRIEVGREERTYHKGNDPHGIQFLRDVIAATIQHDVAAGTRLARHMAEERVERASRYGNLMEQRAVGDTLTSNWAGLVVPQYLTDLYAPAATALRPFADICNRHPLPDAGMSVNISRVTTSSTVGLQATELTAVTPTSIDDTLLTINIQTALGTQNVSRQAVDRGTGVTDVVLQDLFNQYNKTLDATLITQASTGLSAVATATTYTDTTPTGAELYPKILGASAGVEAALLGMGAPTHAVMHSRRWYWLSSQMSSTWPLINWSGIPTQAGGTAVSGSAYGSGIRGMLPSGLQVVVDNNIATTLGGGTEDEIYVVSAPECHLWEDPNAPVFIRAEQTNAANLGVLLVVYGYFAYTFARYSAGAQKVSGSGLSAPSF